MTRLLDSRLTRWSLLALGIVLFAISNLPWHLDDYDQAKQAFTSYEMVECGNWIYQHTPNWWVATKPPLVGWISAGFFAITRSWELAWRLPSFLAGLGLLALIVRAAASHGRMAALLAGCAFGFNLFIPRLGSLVRTDMPLALIVFAIGWLIWEKIRKRETWKAKDRLLLFLLLSAGMLTKGPIIYAFLLPGIVAFEWRRGKMGGSVSAWGASLPWLASFLIFIIWVAGGIHFVPEFLEHVVLREFAGQIQRRDAPAAAVLFLSSAPHPSICPVEPPLDFAGVPGGEKRAGRPSRSRPRDFARNILARCLEPWGPGGHVLRSLQTDRSHFPDRATALFAARFRGG